MYFAASNVFILCLVRILLRVSVQTPNARAISLTGVLSSTACRSQSSCSSVTGTLRGIAHYLVGYLITER